MFNFWAIILKMSFLRCNMIFDNVIFLRCFNNNKNIESFKRCIKLYVLHSPTKEADSSIKEEGGSVAKGVLKVPEGFGHQEPAEVGGEVGQGVSPAAGPEQELLLNLVRRIF